MVLATRGGEEPYKVRAIFDNAGFAIPGEDVKVAGVKVGKIDSLDVTDDFKAVVVLDIQEEAYQDFRRDAECMIRPQSLIGEKFVECEPTQARQANAEPPPALEKIDDGPGEGQYLLPVSQTTKPVDLDLINNITREPQQARLSIILSELGTGVAGRGEDLNDVIRRANPALKEVDKVLEILASENKTLRAAGRRRRHRARTAGARAPSGSPRRSRTRPRWPRRRPSAATTSRPTSRACPRSCASCARRWCGSARSPTRRRPCSPTSARRRRRSTASSPSWARSPRPGSRRSSRSARRRRSARPR